MVAAMANDLREAAKTAAAPTPAIAQRATSSPGTFPAGSLSAADLRRAIVLNEILSPPLALRDE